MLKVIGMTNDLLYLLLRASINASLSDRDAFIEKVSKIIEQQTHKDPEAARRLSDHYSLPAGIKSLLKPLINSQQL